MSPRLTRHAVLFALMLAATAAQAAPPYVVSSRVSSAMADLWEYDLYRVAGGLRTRLLDRRGPEGEPAVDPTGRLIAFVAPVDGHFQVFTMPVAGGACVQRTAGWAEAGHPSFDPAGERLVFPAQAAGGKFGLQVLDLVTGTVRPLVSGAFHCWSPEWSPDGRQVAFVCDRDDTAGDVFTVHVETGTLERLTDDPLAERDPRWSSDGRRIVYSRRVAKDHAELWILDRARGTRAPVFEGVGLNLQPSFTPDGQRVLFTSNRGGSFHIHELDLASGALADCDPGNHSDQNARPLVE